MKGRTLARHIKEGAKNIFRNGSMTFASISAVTVMLLVVGAFLLIIMNVNHFADSLEQDVELRTFIDLGVSEKEQDELLSNLESLPGVASIKFVSKEEGLDSFIASFGEQGRFFETLREENPLNDVFVVQAVDPENTDILATEIEKLDYVDSVEYGQDIFQSLFSATNFIRIVGIILIVALMFTAMFLIANTIKLTIVARKTEIQIMKLVGATNGFIRWPFFVEGLILGVLGSIIPIALLSYGYNRFFNSMGESSGLDFFTLLSPSPLLVQMSLILLGIGAFVGVWGSLMSVRKFLKV